MMGVAAFINMTANATPSGYPPQVRMIQVSRPQPKPKMNCPVAVLGDVTGSVMMKNAPSIKPPDNRWYSGPAKCAGLTVPVSYTHLRAHETVLDLVCRL